MKKTLKLIPAIAMLLISAVMLSTATFAWFSMNTTVSATGMQVKARAEEGLVISNAAAGTYDISANSAKTTVAELYPGSTADLVTFLHSTSTNPASANTQQTYTTGTAWTANSGSYGNYVVHDFYIRSSAAASLTVGSLDVVSVSATVNGGGDLQLLSKSLRVGVKIAGDTTGTPAVQNTYIYAPVTGATATVSVQKAAGAYSSDSSARTDVTALTGSTVSNSAVTSIPAKSENGIHVEIYVWFEGEDASCISNNIIATLQQLDVTVVFGYTAANP